MSSPATQLGEMDDDGVMVPVMPMNTATVKKVLAETMPSSAFTATSGLRRRSVGIPAAGSLQFSD
uniref:Uncharacterized protein n=1 Tax=Arundo donax TaxID=35708 RepID=A0A0A9FYU8_ARUDO